MKEKPILFSTSMVKVILDGKKTMTRRIVRPQPEYYTGEGKNELYRFKEGLFALNFYPSNSTILEHSPYKVGDILWVRERWRCSYHDMGLNIFIAKFPDGDKKEFSFNDDRYSAAISFARKIGRSWQPSIFMPYEAARIFLEVVSVRVGKLQEISKEDAIAEGSYLDRCECLPKENDKTPFEKLFKQNECHKHGKEFKYLWDSINEKRGFSWESNPWVWVIEFRRIER